MITRMQAKKSELAGIYPADARLSVANASG